MGATVHRDRPTSDPRDRPGGDRSLRLPGFIVSGSRGSVPSLRLSTIRIPFASWRKRPLTYPTPPSVSRSYDGTLCSSGTFLSRPGPLFSQQAQLIFPQVFGTLRGREGDPGLLSRAPRPFRKSSPHGSNYSTPPPFPTHYPGPVSLASVVPSTLSGTKVPSTDNGNIENPLLLAKNESHILRPVPVL